VPTLSAWAKDHLRSDHITSKIKQAIKLKTSPARLEHCCSPHWHFVLSCSQWRHTDYLLLSPVNVTRRQDKLIKEALFQFISDTRRKLWSVAAQSHSSVELSALHWCRYNVESTREYYLKSLSVFYGDVTRHVLVVTCNINNNVLNCFLNDYLLCTFAHVATPADR